MKRNKNLIILPGRGDNGGVNAVAPVMQRGEPAGTACNSCLLGFGDRWCNATGCRGDEHYYDSVEVPLRPFVGKPIGGNPKDPAWLYILESIDLALKSLNLPKARMVEQTRSGLLKVRLEDDTKYFMMFSADSDGDNLQELKHYSYEYWVASDRLEGQGTLWTDHGGACCSEGEPAIALWQVKTWGRVGRTYLGKTFDPIQFKNPI